jgi:DNA-binding GntR family transcriptional regulator
MARPRPARETQPSRLENPNPRGLLQLGTGIRPRPLIIQHENLEEQIYTRLRSLIVGRQIPSGQRISLDQLSHEMGVSRTPVLNALKRLAQERVVEFFPRRGIYVRRFSKRQMARLFQVREALEGLSARLAAPRIAREEVDRLAGTFRGLGTALTPGAARRYVERNRHFHWRLVEIADNEDLAAAMNSINLMFFVYQDGLVRPPAETIPEHRAILEALRRHDPDASEAAMRLHIRRSVERLETEAEAEEAEGSLAPQV